MVGQEVLSEVLLGEGKENVVKILLFQRLSPLLLLKVLNPGALSKVCLLVILFGSIYHIQIDAAMASRLAVELAHRMTQEYEYDEVRRVSAEIMARLRLSAITPVILPHFAQNHINASVAKYMVNKRLLSIITPQYSKVFALSQSVLSGGNVGDEDDWRARIVDVLIMVSSSGSDKLFGRDDDDVRKLVLGSIDAIAACITIELERGNTTLCLLMRRLADPSE